MLVKEAGKYQTHTALCGRYALVHSGEFSYVAEPRIKFESEPLAEKTKATLITVYLIIKRLLATGIFCRTKNALSIFEHHKMRYIEAF